MSIEVLKEKFIPQYKSVGGDKFYRFLLAYAVSKLVHLEKQAYKSITPELEFLSYYDQLIFLYRREGEEVYLDMARTFRRAAHKIYRVMLKKNMTSYNPKFLNLV